LPCCKKVCHRSSAGVGSRSPAWRGIAEELVNKPAALPAFAGAGGAFSLAPFGFTGFLLFVEQNIRNVLEKIAIAGFDTLHDFW